MHWIDFTIVGVFMSGLLVLGFSLSKRAGTDTESFIVAGRKMPWWLVGASLLAANLNASSMLQDSRKVRQDGIGGLWFSWRSIITASIGAAFFLRLWRRAGFVTQMEFYRCRYAGWRADAARTYDTFIYGLISSPMWAAIGLVGMKKVASVLLGLEPSYEWMGVTWNTDLVIVMSLVAITLVYSAASGVYGVVWTDLIESVIALVATYALMVIVLGQVGGPTGLGEKLASHEDAAKLLSVLPTAGAVFAFYVIFAVLEQGGFNPHVQRWLSLKSEREVMHTSLYSTVLNFVFKAWPYYICGLAGMFLISDAYLMENFASGTGADGQPIVDHEMVFPALVERYLPVGLTGLMIAGFLSAFMSSFDTNIHNAAAIFTNDLYKPYLVPGKSEAHYVGASRWYMVVAALMASVVGVFVNDILYLFIFLLGVLQSVGLIKLLRFVWWRVNGWGELAAMVCSLTITSLIVIEQVGKQLGYDWPLFDGWVRQWIPSMGLEVDNDTYYVFRTLALVGISTVASVVVVLVTPAEPMEKLVEFYRRVRPFGWWGPVREVAGVENEASDSIPWLTAISIAMIATTLGLVFAMMGLLLAWWVLAGLALGVAGIGWVLYCAALRRLYPPESLQEPAA